MVTAFPRNDKKVARCAELLTWTPWSSHGVTGVLNKIKNVAKFPSAEGWTRSGRGALLTYGEFLDKINAAHCAALTRYTISRILCVPMPSDFHHQIWVVDVINLHNALPQSVKPSTRFHSWDWLAETYLKLLRIEIARFTRI